MWLPKAVRDADRRRLRNAEQLSVGRTCHGFPRTAVENLRHAKVSQLQVAVHCYHDVLGLEIAKDDVVGVDMLKGQNQLASVYTNLASRAVRLLLSHPIAGMAWAANP